MEMQKIYENREIFYKACENGNEDQVRAWLNEEYDYDDQESENFEASNFDLPHALKLAKGYKRTSDLIQYFIDIPELIKKESIEFIQACEAGDLCKVDKMMGPSSTTPHADFSFNDNAALKCALANGHKEIADIVEDYIRPY